MPRVHLMQTNFTAGEFAPQMAGRVEIERYPNAVKSLQNCFSLVQGGVKRRPGTFFSKAAKHSNKAVRMLPFVFSRSQSYIIELGDQYIRFFDAVTYSRIETSPGVAYEIVSPFTEAQLADVDYAQRADTMFLFHPDVETQRLQRFAATNWRIAAAPWQYTPMADNGEEPAATITLSSAAVGTGITATASAAVFLASDVGRDITKDGGVATITGYTSTTVVTVSITSAFTGTSVTAGWTLTDSPQTTCTPSAVGTVGATITLTLGAAGWRAAYVGKHVEINGGLVEITGYTSTTVVDAKVLRVLDFTTAAEAFSWSVLSSMWGGDFGYPSTGVFYDQRLVVSGVPGWPRHVFGSYIGNTLDFLLGIEDSDAFAIPIADSDEIRFMSSVKALTVFSYNGEFTLQGGNDTPLTPTSPLIYNQSGYGSGDVRPVRISNDVYFVQRSGLKLRAFTYRFAEDEYEAPDMTKLANHITGPGLVEMSYQQEPYGTLLCLRSDGVIAQVTVDRSENVIAWAPWTTTGSFKSIATVPSGDKDVTWCAVQRSGGVYIEYFSEYAFSDSAVEVETMPATVFSGFSHLNGLSVVVRADGVPMENETVASGNITLPREALTVQAGIGFTPYVELLPAEFPTGTGTAQGAMGRTGEIRVRFYDTPGCIIGDPVSGTEYEEQIATRRLGEDVLDSPAENVTGWVSVNRLGWDKETGRIYFKQTQPVEFQILAVVRRITVND